ncbi:MAG TPA: flagellar biosynthetic protein FliO [bacterium]|nr:flagellar biosynthetic protein FliO [bacterium]
MKKIFLFFISQLVFADLAYGIVKLKDVSQSGYGSTGIVRVEFNGNYKKSKADVEYKDDRIEIVLKDVFSLPPNRVYKVSSEKSSVSKISSKLLPGNIIRVSVYFRIPLDVIQKTSNIEVDDNILKFTYKTALDEPVASAEPSNEKPVDAYALAMQDNGNNGIQDNGSTEDQNANAINGSDINENVITDKAKEVSKAGPSLLSVAKIWKILKGALVLLLVVVFSIGVFYLYRRYSSGMSESMNLSFGRSEPVSDNNKTVKDMNKVVQDNFRSVIPNTNTGYTPTNNQIKVLSSLNLDHGKTVHVVEYMGEKMLIATSKDSVTMLSKLDMKSGSINNEQPDLFKNPKFKDRFGSDF